MPIPLAEQSTRIHLLALRPLRNFLSKRLLFFGYFCKIIHFKTHVVSRFQSSTPHVKLGCAKPN